MDLIAPGEGLLFWQISFLLSLIYLGFWAYALFDALRLHFRPPHTKILWALTILFAQSISTFLYLAIVTYIRKDRRSFTPELSKNMNSN